MAISRNLEREGLYINRFTVGLYDNRSPLIVPMSAMGIQMINRMDVLWDGLNIDLTHKMTLIRRPGFLRYCSAQLGSSEIPQTFYSFKNTSGTIKAMVETSTRVAWFDTTTINTVITKNTTNQGSINKVGSTLYYCDGNDSDTLKWDGTTTSKWGIISPTTAPTLSYTSGSLSPFTGYKYVYVFMNSSTGHISSASPISGNTGALTNKNITVVGDRSTDAQVDKVQIYRTLDGGGNYYLLATISNPVSGTWSYTDSTADSGLNIDLQPSLANENDPPPSGMSLTCFYLGRVWGAVGNYLYAGGGPDITNGVPEECFPPANVWTLPGKITAMIPTSQGLVVYTYNDMFVVLGTTLASFVVKLLQANFGVPSQNAVCQDGDTFFMFTSHAQLISYSASSMDEIGFAIQVRLSAFNPDNVYLTLHRNGTDEGVFVSDGSTTAYRYSVSLGCWSTAMQPVGGVKCLKSIEVTSSNYRVMLGRATGSGYILDRDPSTYTDDGTAYSANVVFGPLVLAPVGSVEIVNSVLTQVMPVGTYPIVSVLMNEITGTFVALPNPVVDPPELSAAPATSLLARRHYMKSAQTALPQMGVFMLIKVAFVAEAQANEFLAFGVN